MTWQPANDRDQVSHDWELWVDENDKLFFVEYRQEHDMIVVWELGEPDDE